MDPRPNERFTFIAFRLTIVVCVSCAIICAVMITFSLTHYRGFDYIGGRVIGVGPSVAEVCALPSALSALYSLKTRKWICHG